MEAGSVDLSQPLSWNPRRIRLNWDGPLSNEYSTLLEQAAAGDDQAWATIVSQLGPRVHGLIAANTRDDELAQEITQIVFCTIAQKINDYVEQGRFESWVFRIAMNKLRDEMRRRGRQARPVGEVGFPASQRSGREDRAAYNKVDPDTAATLWDAVRDLAPQDQEILHLRHVAGLGFKEIADLLDAPVGTLLARHFRAVRRLREQLGDAFGETAFGAPDEQ
jgi:RNA polymerase sigma-70 factor (ECF subfamily)